MDLNLLNANVGRLLTNIWAVISFFKEFAVDGAKDVSIIYINADGSESVKTFPNIAKQISRLETWKNDFLAKNGTNNGLIGATHFNVAQCFTDKIGAGFVHIKLPIKVNIDRNMFYIHLRGHSHCEASILDATFTGYSYGIEGIVSVGVLGNNRPIVYSSQDGYVTCRISLLNIYFATVAVDSMHVGSGRSFKKGDIEIQINKIEKI